MYCDTANLLVSSSTLPFSECISVASLFSFTRKLFISFSSRRFATCISISIRRFAGWDENDDAVDVDSNADDAPCNLCKCKWLGSGSTKSQDESNNSDSVPCTNFTLLNSTQPLPDPS